jgi:hypothetical protein
MTKIARIPLFANPFVSAGLLAIAFAMLYAVGIQGVMKAAPLGDDFLVFYRAGGLFHQGVDPWLTLMNSPQPYSYPPHSLSIVAAYNLLPQSLALGLHIVISLISIAIVCFCANIWFLHIERFPSMNIAQALALALIIGNPYMATSLYQGQMTLPIMAALFLSWHFLQSDRWVIAGLLLGIATLKPQLSILYIVWLILSLNFRVLMVGGLFAALLIVPGAVMFGITAPFESWLTSLHGYSRIAINAPGSDFVVGIASLLAAHGFQPNRVVLVGSCLACVGILYAYRRCFDPMVTLHGLLVISFTFLYAHDYDYVAVILLWSFGLLIAMTGGSLTRLSLYGGMALVFFIPQRLLRDFDIPLVVHSRTLILVAFCLLVMAWSNERRRPAV